MCLQISNCAEHATSKDKNVGSLHYCHFALGLVLVVLLLRAWRAVSHDQFERGIWCKQLQYIQVNIPFMVPIYIYINSPHSLDSLTSVLMFSMWVLLVIGNMFSHPSVCPLGLKRAKCQGWRGIGIIGILKYLPLFTRRFSLELNITWYESVSYTSKRFVSMKNTFYIYENIHEKIMPSDWLKMSTFFIWHECKVVTWVQITNSGCQNSVCLDFLCNFFVFEKFTCTNISTKLQLKSCYYLYEIWMSLWVSKYIPYPIQVWLIDLLNRK